MVRDLYYFHECDLDRTNIKDFYESLPSHLRSKFRGSLHGIEIVRGNVLQGYRGPSDMCNGGSGDSGVLRPSHGLQEIKFWWAARKDINFIPLIGNALYGCERGWQSLRGDTDWSSLYFDSRTGECLGHDGREAAEKLKSRAREADAKRQQARRSDRERSAGGSAARSSYRGDDDDDRCCGSRSSSHGNDHWRRNHQEESALFRQRIGNANLPSELYAHGVHLYCKQHSFDRAAGRFEEALCLYEDEQNRRMCHDMWMSAMDEKRAEDSNSEGDERFNCGEYSRALMNYRNAFEGSGLAALRQKYKENHDKAQAELDAQKLYYAGDYLFKQARYSEARDKFQEAFDKSSVSREIREYESGRDQAQGEIDAMSLNSQGDNLFNRGRYKEALSKYQEARGKSTHETVNARHRYTANADKAKIEINAIRFNSEGDNLFNQSKYNEAQSKYQQACNTSKVAAEIEKYRANNMRARAEIDAINLNYQGNNLFDQGKYNEAQSKYQEAYDKSEVAAAKNTYLLNGNKAQDIVNKISALGALWDQAWAAESDASCDRSGEAADIFQRVLKESRDSLIAFPGNRRFEQYRTLAILKIEGNETFNRGLESQQSGIALFQAAQELNQQREYEAALQEFKKANECFQKALEMFEMGSRSDQRFASCVEFVQEQINEVNQSIEITQQRMLSAGMQKLDVEVGGNDHSSAHTREFDAAGKHNNNYSQHI